MTGAELFEEGFAEGLKEGRERVFDELLSLPCVVFPVAVVGKEAAGAYYREDDIRAIAYGVREKRNG